MKSPAPDLERIVELARRTQPSETSLTDMRRLARRAVLAAGERRRTARYRRSFALTAMACFVLLLPAVFSPLRDAAREGLASLLRMRRDAAAPTQASTPTPKDGAGWTPLELLLPSGDRLVASPGAQFELLENTNATRRIALRAGVAAFAVKPLARGEQFSVQTPHLRVLVHGTVFSVEVDALRTRVRVHEGAVLIQSGEQIRSLAAGERYGSDATNVPERVADALETRIGALVLERKRASPTPVATPVATDAGVVGGAGLDPPAAPRASLRRPARPTLERARAALHAGDPASALSAARSEHSSHESRGEWLAVEGDALRALGHAHEAASAYREAQNLLAGDARAHTAFKAAELFLRVLDDPNSALSIVDVAALDAPSSPLRERALLLRIEAGERLGQPVRTLASRYLAAYPDSAGAPHMRKLLAQRNAH